MAKKFVGAIFTALILGGVVFLIWSLASNNMVLGYNQGYQPDQPLPFSHETHAGKFEIDCKYCHAGVSTTRHASVPSLNICMNCHIAVKLDSEHVQKIQAAYSSEKPIEWQKVHLLPDHVKFNHAPHIQAGKDCTTCHGEIQKMPVVKQVQSMSMGWCVNCHREKENNAPVTCGTCHY